MSTTGLDPITRAHGGLDGLARIGAALVHACAADPLLYQRLPRRVVDAIELHDTVAHNEPNAVGVDVVATPSGRVLTYQRRRP